MFTNQVSSLVQKLIAAGMPTEQANVVAELGNCAGPLDHRAPVAIDSTPSQKRQSPDGAPDWGIEGITPTNAPYATFQVSNWDSTLNGDTVEGGLTMIVNGGLYADFIIGPDGSGSTIGAITVEVVSDIRYDSTTHSFQMKTRDVLAPADSVESDWLNVHAATLLARVVRGATYNVDVTDTFVNQHTEDVYVLEAGEESTDEVFDTEQCNQGTGIQVLDGAGDISADSDVVEMDTTSAGFAGTLPAYASSISEKLVLGTGTTGNDGSVVVSGGGTINGGTSISVADNELWMFYIGGSEWKAKKLG
jgi:hypothetical protein